MHSVQPARQYFYGNRSAVTGVEDRHGPESTASSGIAVGRLYLIACSRRSSCRMHCSSSLHSDTRPHSLLRTGWSELVWWPSNVQYAVAGGLPDGVKAIGSGELAVEVVASEADREFIPIADITAAWPETGRMKHASGYCVSNGLRAMTGRSCSSTVFTAVTQDALMCSEIQSSNKRADSET